MVAYLARRRRAACDPAAWAFTLLISGLLLGASSRGAHAYLDAGTGSMILQVLLGGFAGLALVGKLYWHRLLVLLRLRDDAPALGRDADEPRPEARVER
jgi:hypothetical protein